MIKCYHFCSNEFLSQLLECGVVDANKKLNLIKGEPASYVKDYAFNVKKINNGNGMFFSWSNPSYKGDIKFDENVSFSLIELEIEDDSIAIKTNYENWCNLGVDIEEANGDLELADKYCREDYHIVDGLQGSYNSIFDISDDQMEIQVLLPFLKKEWIKSIRKCSDRRI